MATRRLHPLAVAAAYLLAIAGIVGMVHVAAPPPEEVARASAQASLDAWVDGDYAGFRDTWSAYPTRLLSERDYLAITDETCPPKPCASASAYLVGTVDIRGDRATAHTTRSIAGKIVHGVFPLVHEQGTWRYHPDRGSLDIFERIHSDEWTVDEAIAEIGTATKCPEA